MLRKSRNRTFNRRDPALVFAALGDETRLRLVAKPSRGGPYPISKLAEGSRLTRQAITKHLRVLERAGVVREMRSGRERLFRSDPEPMEAIHDYLESVSTQWDQALARLKVFVEE
jgi:DNA-binding transcriptional ArsR family regulator